MNILCMGFEWFSFFLLFFLLPSKRWVWWWRLCCVLFYYTSPRWQFFFSLWLIGFVLPFFFYSCVEFEWMLLLVFKLRHYSESLNFCENSRRWKRHVRNFMKTVTWVLTKYSGLCYASYLIVMRIKKMRKNEKSWTQKFKDFWPVPFIPRGTNYLPFNYILHFKIVFK